MKVEISIDKKYSNPKVVIYCDEYTSDIQNVYERILSSTTKKILAIKDDKTYLLDFDEIDRKIRFIIYGDNFCRIKKW